VFLVPRELCFLWQFRDLRFLPSQDCTMVIA
jgi:hypothetical protein